MTLATTNGSKEIPKKHEELWTKRSKTNKKHIRWLFNLNNELHLKKALELCNTIIVARAVLWGQQVLPASFLRWMFE